jgi:hypothetical protein
MSITAAKWRQRHTITATVDEFSGYEFDGKILDIISKLADLVAKHGPEVTLDYDSNYYHPYESTPSPRFNVRIERLETIPEWEKRVTEYETHMANVAEAERKQYEALKAKFGDK